MRTEKRECDVLVIGNGGAGLRAAVEAAQAGCKVLLLSKISSTAVNSTSLAIGWITKVEPGEDFCYFQEVVEESNYLCDQRLVGVFAEETAWRIPELKNFGVPMAVETGSPQGPMQYRLQGEVRRWGDALRLPLRAELARRGGEELHNTVVSKLLARDGSVVGAVAVNFESQSVLSISSGATILATGGASCVYGRTDNPPGTTGDGYALAYRAGAELTDMEFVTFVYPHDLLRDLFVTGGTDPQKYLERGRAHYFLGGVCIDALCQTSVKNLLAAGEVTGGLFGSARLGGSALAEIVVFGARAGQTARKLAEAGKAAVPDGAEEEYDRLRNTLERRGENPTELCNELGDTMWVHAGVLRTDESLSKVQNTLKSIRERARGIGLQGDFERLKEFIELEMMLDTADLITLCARERTESRGAHWRMDYRQADNARWLKNIVVRQDTTGQPRLRFESPVMTKLTSPTTPKIGTTWSGGHL